MNPSDPNLLNFQEKILKITYGTEGKNPKTSLELSVMHSS